ncbi:hypothetical protein [Rubrivirga litoralis]|uniref:Uncharacterized protein n=1 Tax=Rubrivirga litoralis TaxID=3075598 RepID=A0ABU3BTU5_9BACT|nr:hypothetical protein [Rubrivirga sp. F394]MDT0632716.1 hypothetical protein [Rubrivirga sp. F394]
MRPVLFALALAALAPRAEAQHHPAHVTVPVAPDVLAEPLDALTWSFADDGSALRLAWGPLAADFPLARADR